MAFKRLVVTRSLSLAAFGGLCLMGWTAFESSAVKGWGSNAFWMTGYIGFALLVVRGLYGPFWGELRVDRTARAIKTADGEVIAFDKIGPLQVQPTQLVAGDIVLYRGPTAELNERHDALAAVLGRGRLQLYSLQRLAHHTIVPLALLGIAGILIVAGTSYQYIVLDGVHEIEYKLIELGALFVSIAMVWYALAGSKSERQLRVDPIAGVIQLDDGKIMRFDELGALKIDVSERLVAANVQRFLYWSYRRSHTELRLARLQTAMLQHQLRRALEAPVIDGDAFRSSGVDIKHEVDRIAGDSPHKRAALEALTKDPDPTIADRARSLL